MTVPNQNSDDNLDGYVRQAILHMASALGPFMADLLLRKGHDTFMDHHQYEYDTSALATGNDPSNVLTAMLVFWDRYLKNRFPHPEYRWVYQMLHDIKHIRNYYMGHHRQQKSRFKHIEAIGEIRRLVSAFAELNATEQSMVNTVIKIEKLQDAAGTYLYGQSRLSTSLDDDRNEGVDLPPVMRPSTGVVHQTIRAVQGHMEPGDEESEAGSSLAGSGSADLDIQGQIEEEGVAGQDSGRETEIGDTNENISPVAQNPPAGKTAAFYVRSGDHYRELKDDDAALVEYESALELDPRSASAHYGVGRCYARKRDYDQAIASLTMSLDNDSEFAAAYGTRGLVHLARGEQDEAERDFAAAMALPEESVHAHFGMGKIHQNRGEFELAIAMYDAAIRLSPELAHVHRQRGRACRSIDDMEQAIVSFRKVTELQPDRVQGWRTLARTCDEARDTQGAIEAYRSLVCLDQNDVEGWSELGRLHYNCRDYDDAVDCLQKSIDLDASTGFTHLLRGKALEAAGEPGQAMESYQQAVEIDETDCDAWIALGRLYAEDGNYEQAAEMFRQAANLGPQMPHQKAELAGGFLFIGEYEEAIEGYRDALGMWDMFGYIGTVYFVSPDEQVHAWNNLGVAHLDNGNVDEAISCCWEAVELWERLHEVYGDFTGEDGSLDPSSLFMALSNLVVACAQTGDYSRAIEGLDRAIEVSADNDDLLELRDRIVRYADELAELDEGINRAPGDPEIRCLRALFHQKNEDFEKSIADLNDALDCDPGSDLMVEIFNELGLIYMQLESYDRAMEEFCRAIDNKNNFSEAYYNRGILWRRLDQLDDALADFDLAIAFNKCFAVAYQNRGYLQLAMGNREEAQKDFDQARELGFELSPGREIE